MTVCEAFGVAQGRGGRGAEKQGETEGRKISTEDNLSKKSDDYQY